MTAPGDKALTSVDTAVSNWGMAMPPPRTTASDLLTVGWLEGSRADVTTMGISRSAGSAFI
ncbi:MAG: hypothetical protein OXG68_07795, partial [Chloroflexi bacterium]|nr:hypothetical protein [Chloroflexota bacterium]